MPELPDHCEPCREGAAPLTDAEARARTVHVPEWSLELPRLHREFRMKDFRDALAWVNRVGMLAEEEQHHPDIHITGWNQVELVLWTHAANGLHDNDFVMARAIDRLWEQRR